MFDITSIDVVAKAEEGIDIVIVNPRTGERTDLEIKVKGVYSSKVRELLAKAVQRDEMRKKSRMVAQNSTDDISMLLASVTLGWKNMFERGKELPFSRGEAERIYSEYPLIRGQVWEAVNDVGNFISD